jgi:hypothetical protein
MKATSRIFFLATACVAVFFAILHSACTNKCGTTTCQNGGTCTNNVCVCPTGYSGNSCQTAWTDKFITTYNCSRSNCSPAVAGTNSWQSAITKASTNSGYTIYISNFDNSNTTQTATVDSIGNLQISPAAGSYGVSAKGAISGDTIKLSFTTYVSGGITGYSCNMVMVKL